jgi:hypothetical protein
MGLQKTWTKPSTGETFNDAYHRLDSIFWSQNDMGIDQLKIVVFTFKNKTDSDTNRQLKISVRRYQMESGFDKNENVLPNVHSIAYDYLKSLPEFAGAVDI